jgi:hypothetical protein
MTKRVQSLWCYDDVHNWGKSLATAAQAGGLDAHLFEEPREPHDGYVFMHMHHHPQTRLAHKRMMSLMSYEPSLTLIPSYRASVLFDDKLEQARQFSNWLPRTRVFYTPGSAYRWLQQPDIYPFLSKSMEGTNSYNVRLIENFDQAKLEVRQSFSDVGVKTKYGQTQRGYLLWQDIVPDSDGMDMRVLAIGSKRLIIKRHARGKTLLSVSAIAEPIIALNDEILSCLATANRFFFNENLRWGTADFVYNRTAKQWVFLEYSVNSVIHSFFECSMIDCSRETPTLDGNKCGKDIWDTLVNEIKTGEFIDAY